jgi:hemoglobin
MLAETVDRASVERLVHDFYGKVIKDDLVGPYFIRTLGNDQKNEKWFEHFWILTNFWMHMMEGEEGYRGDPFVPHLMIGELYTETFDRWLKLFDETVHEHYAPEVAEKFNTKANTLATRFKAFLEVESMDEDD